MEQNGKEPEMSNKLKTVQIHGKNYVMVNERIIKFRADYPSWSLVSEIVSCENSVCVIKALICDDKGITRATGYAREVEGDGNINKTSFVENCETSAWGRALGCLGIGIDASVASAEEVSQAIEQQSRPARKKTSPPVTKTGFWGMFSAKAKADGVSSADTKKWAATLIGDLAENNQIEIDMSDEHDAAWPLLAGYLDGYKLKEKIAACNLLED
jgi:hypothetical protein